MEALLELGLRGLEARLRRAQPPLHGGQTRARGVERPLVGEERGMALGARLEVLDEELLEARLALVLLLLQSLHARLEQVQHVLGLVLRRGLRLCGLRRRRAVLVGVRRPRRERQQRDLLLVAVLLAGLVAGARVLGLRLRRRLLGSVVLIGVVGVVVVALADLGECGAHLLPGALRAHGLHGLRRGAQDRELLGAAVVRGEEGLGHELVRGPEARPERRELRTHELVGRLQLLRMRDDGPVPGLQRRDLLGDFAIRGDHGAVPRLLGAQLLVEDRLLLGHFRGLLLLRLRHALREAAGLRVDALHRLVSVLEHAGHGGELREAVRARIRRRRHRRQLRLRLRSRGALRQGHRLGLRRVAEHAGEELRPPCRRGRGVAGGQGADRDEAGLLHCVETAN
mmetsp:Transcript_13943/g.38026  ORF Transcript_13943/g.38026 Transcript_13943/m.38026 type:complete len:398 (+) Transcript_13943:358-1551(+)